MGRTGLYSLPMQQFINSSLHEQNSLMDRMQEQGEEQDPGRRQAHGRVVPLSSISKKGLITVPTMPELPASAADRLLTQRARDWLHRNQSESFVEAPFLIDEGSAAEYGDGDDWGEGGRIVFRKYDSSDELTRRVIRGNRPLSATGVLPQRTHSSRLLSKVQIMGGDMRNGMHCIFCCIYLL